MKKFHVLLTLLMLMISVQGAHATVNLSKDQLDRVYASTLEVVVKKIEHDSLSYEKPLPMHLIPYQVRNDKYWSLGTAFAIGPDTFVSAAHVFNLDVNSLYRDFYLRDKNGKVYAPNKISKFAGNRDFIVFSVKDLQIKNHLETNTAPVINNRVYAVGNAHGEGIVIRDGLYTSNTPEDLDGAWQWMRFSAAASPGNSGGPLLDDSGRVVGIVLRKSENENLNYALPIKEVLEAPAQLAVHDSLIAYGLENLNAQKTGRFSYKRDLPMSFPALNRDLASALDEFYNDLFRQLLAEHEQKTFPRGEGSDYLLHKTYTAFFPHIIALRDDGNWLPTRPENIQRADLGKNGFLQYGKLGATLLIRTHKPDGQNLEAFLADGKQSMDYLLKALGYKRTIGSEEIRVTSLGKPVLEATHQDRYGRTWTIRKWITEFDDSAVVTMSLPTPGGDVSMLRGDSVGIIDSHLLDMKVLADFVYLSYYGTLQEWSEFLALGKNVPESLQNLTLDYGSGKQLKFASRDIVFNYDASLQAISDDSDLRVYMSYFKHDDEVVWDIARVAIGEHKDNLNYFEVARNLRPSERMSDSDKSGWERLVQQEFPFNKTSYFKDKSTYIGMVYTNGQTAAKLQDRASLFSVFYGREGKIEQAEIASKLEAVVKNLDIVH